jgi:hypothetical protein
MAPTSGPASNAEPDPVEVVRDFVDILSRRPPDPRCRKRELGVDVVLYPTGRRPANFDEVLRALGDPEARKLFGRDLVSLWEAEAILGQPGPAIVTRAKAGELYGLFTSNGEWLLSRRRVSELRDLDAIGRWLTPEALAAARV